METSLDYLGSNRQTSLQQNGRANRPKRAQTAHEKRHKSEFVGQASFQFIAQHGFSPNSHRLHSPSRVEFEPKQTQFRSGIATQRSMARQIRLRTRTKSSAENWPRHDPDHRDFAWRLASQAGRFTAVLRECDAFRRVLAMFVQKMAVDFTNQNTPVLMSQP